MTGNRWFSTPLLDIRDYSADRSHYDPITVPEWRRIVMHCTDGRDSRDWLSTTSKPPVSVHRLISRDGQIWKIVDDRHIAFHVGFSTLFPYAGHALASANWTSLGIELENKENAEEDYTSAQLESAAKQVVEWFGAYGYLPVVGHRDMDARKRDPWRFPWETFMGDVFRRCAGFSH